MARPRSEPTYLRHSSGQARTVINGRTIYLGPYGSPESREKFAVELAAWRKANPKKSARLRKPRTVADLLAMWNDHAERKYHGKAELVAYRYALRPVYLSFGSLDVAEFGPLALSSIRDMIASGYTDPVAGVRRPSCRRVVNRHLVRIRTVWRWAESMELVAAGSWARLRTLPGLMRGDSGALDHEPVKAAPDADIDAALAMAGGVVESLGAVLYWSGARPSELYHLNAGDVDRSGPVWRVHLEHHKTAHKGKARTLYFGPHAQRWLMPLLCQKLPGALVFPNLAGKPYDNSTFRQQIIRACDRAGIPRWFPYRLRHNAATRLRRECGWDAARMLLGHSSLDTTAIYAEDDQDDANDAAAKAG